MQSRIFPNQNRIIRIQKIEDGQQVAIKISNYSYRHHQLFIGKFNDFKIQQTSNQNSSIQDISRQIVNNMKVIIISEDQLKYLLQEFPELEACQLRKFEEYFKTAFYFVQIEDIEELLEKAKVEFKRMNEKYVKNYVQMKKQKNQKNWMKKIKEVKNYNQEVFKLYCYNIMETFNTELLNDINDIQMNIEEYQSNQNLSLYQEAIIELGHRELNPNDPDSIENLLFESDFKFEPKITKLTDLPNGTFITLWIRNYSDDTVYYQQLSFELIINLLSNRNYKKLLQLTILNYFLNYFFYIVFSILMIRDLCYDCRRIIQVQGKRFKKIKSFLEVISRKSDIVNFNVRFEQIMFIGVQYKYYQENIKIK